VVNGDKSFFVKFFFRFFPAELFSVLSKEAIALLIKLVNGAVMDGI